MDEISIAFYYLVSENTYGVAFIVFAELIGHRLLEEKEQIF